MKRKLEIEGEKARSLYKTASRELRILLEENFGKEFFSIDIRDRIKTYEDACLELGINPNHLPDVSQCQPEDRASIIASHKLYIITRALNESWKANWANSNEKKWSPWFYMSPSGFAFDVSFYFYSVAGAGGGSRLCFKSEELATYAAKQFIELWKEQMCY